MVANLRAAPNSPSWHFEAEGSIFGRMTPARGLYLRFEVNASEELCDAAEAEHRATGREVEFGSLSPEDVAFWNEFLDRWVAARS